MPDPQDHDTGDTDDYSVTTLWIHADDLDPDEITKLLRIEPDWAWRRGDTSYEVNKKLEITQEPTGFVHKRGVWKKRIDKEKQQLTVPEQLLDWSARLRPFVSGLSLLRKRGHDLHIDCYIDEGPIVIFELSMELVDSLSELGISVSFGFYDRVGLLAEEAARVRAKQDADG